MNPNPIEWDTIVHGLGQMCRDTTGELYLDAISGGVPGYSYEWVGADSTYYTENPVGVYAGLYTLTVRDTNSVCNNWIPSTVLEADLFDVKMTAIIDIQWIPNFLCRLF